jgi:precorrin-2 dehydrogenase/sirohydrochlorin ferrochelatase
MIVDLNLKGKQAIVIGGGTEGVRKVKGLLGQGCEIVVISNRLNRYLIDLQKQGKIKVIKARLNDARILDNYKNPFLVLAATNDKSLNRVLVKKGRSLGSFVYSVDDPPFSDFSYASIINIQDIIQVAISTSGKSPIVARMLRIRAERVLKRIIKKSDIDNARLQEFARNAARSRINSVTKRKEFLYSLINDDKIQNLIMEDRIDDAKIAAIKLLDERTTAVGGGL